MTGAAGAVVSSRYGALAAGPTFPAPSIARTAMA
jgi:hypothetical protein